MGIDFSHCNAHWAYSGFHRVRNEIAKKLYDIDLDQMKGFNGKLKWDKKIPLYPFLYHSDCDGKLSPKEIKRCLPDLRRVVNLLENKYDRENLNLLIEGMENAVECKESLDFR
jgi:hypothetical protein